MFLIAALGLAVVIFFPTIARAATDVVTPELTLRLAGGDTEPEKVSLGLEILFLLTVLSMAPAILLTVTSFTRIILVFHFVR